MAEGTLSPYQVATVTLTGRADRVTVETGDAEIWFTTDGTTPKINFPAGSHRTSVRTGPRTVPAGTTSPTVVKLIAREVTDYLVTSTLPEPQGLPVFDQVIFRAPDGSSHRITIDADGALVTERLGG